MPAVYDISELKAQLTPIFERYGVRRATLFGSYGKGTATPKSDIDILVDSGLRGLRFVGLLDELQRSVNKPIDLFDVAHIVPDSRVDREIRRSGVSLYEK